MQYNRNTWSSRIGEGLNKYTDSISGKTLQLTPTPDSIIEPGTPFTADWMNNIEQGLVNASAAANTWIASQVTAVNAEAFQYNLTIPNYIPAVGNVIVFQAPSDAGESFLFTINGAGPSSGTWYQVALSDLSVDVTGAWVGTAMLNVTISNVVGETGNTLAFFRSGGGGSKEVVPSYTGNSQIFGDGTKGYIEMYDSGVLTFNTNVTVDMFLVGGGGGGAATVLQYGGSGGGGGGYATLFQNVPFSKNEEITCVIGAGGSSGQDGGATSVNDYVSNGGKAGLGGKYVSGGSFTGSGGGDGGAGGSGGGGGGGGWATGGRGGFNGSDGITGESSQDAAGVGGTGNGTSTYEFFDTTLRLFSGGGGGGAGPAGSSSMSPRGGGAGGAGGGGAGGNGGVYEGVSPKNGTAGTANTGGGGGGAGGGSKYGNTAASGGAGGSGIAIIRWGDWTTA